MKKINYQDGTYTLGREVRWSEGVFAAADIIRNKKFNEITKILDVGCGDGSFLNYLIKYLKRIDIDGGDFVYYGVDMDKRYKKQIESLNGNFICGNILELNNLLDTIKFDFIVASEIIEHVDETDVLINSIKSVLKSDGLIYLTTPNLASWHSRLLLLFGYQPLATEISNVSSEFGKIKYLKKYYDKTIHHIRVFTYKALKEFVEYHGLNIVRSKGIGYRKVDSFLFGNLLKELAPVIILFLKKNNKIIKK